MYVSVIEKKGSYFRGRCEVDPSSSVECDDAMKRCWK